MKSCDQRCMGKEGTFRPAALIARAVRMKFHSKPGGVARVVDLAGLQAKLGIGCRSGSKSSPVCCI